MNQSAFEACLPWAICVIVAVVALRLLVMISGARLKLKRLPSIHSCEKGTVQSLSFVLTLPFFVMILMLIVQASQIMIGNILVQYAAFAAARSAIVWIPSSIEQEYENEISSISLIEQQGEDYRYSISSDPSSPKYSRIRSAAVLAVMPLGPSGDYGYQLDPSDEAVAAGLINLYQGLDGEAMNNGRFPARVRNKLAYSQQNTQVTLTFWHRQNEAWPYKEPPLQRAYQLPPDVFEFRQNELGWQDHLTARVDYNLPLLPGPVRFFASQAASQSFGGEDTDGTNGNGSGCEPSEQTDANGETYIWRLFAEATLGIEGEKPLVQFREGLEIQ